MENEFNITNECKSLIVTEQPHQYFNPLKQFAKSLKLLFR